MIRSRMSLGVIGALGLFTAGCVSVKPNVLYIDDTPDEEKEMFYAANEIYSDELSEVNISESWATTDKNCITVETKKEAAFKGQSGLHIKWNRVKEGCPWLGLGFGWDNWSGKDLSQIKEEAAVELYVKMVSPPREVLPWAIGLEDFAGSQAWLGMSKAATKADMITQSEWTRIELPLSEFDWEDQQANAQNIKQIIFQFEAEGEVYIDEIKIVPYHGGYRKRANLNEIALSGFVVDGEKMDAIWQTAPISIGPDALRMAVSGSKLILALEAEDNTPLENEYTDGSVWNGDCFEIAFSTDKEASPKRTFLMSSDLHLGIALTQNPVVWNWSKEQAFMPDAIATKKTERGYVMEAVIDLAKLGVSPWEIGELYGLEMAVDHGTLKKGRVKQHIWNSNNPDFGKFPNTWGELFIGNPL